MHVRLVAALFLTLTIPAGAERPWFEVPVGAGAAGGKEALALVIREKADPASGLGYDRLARRIAALSGLTYTGTLGVLLKAKSAGHLPAVRPVLKRLRGRGMRIHDDLMLRVLTIAEEL